ncbi:MAG: AAA family ATPase [Nanoarchaeota archaeon]|nr:AAA family ATPase [Nanoarchaeota archaeon]
MVQVIGLVGPIGGGKGAVKDDLVKEYGYEQVTMGDLVREETLREGLELTRDNLIKVSESRRDKYGQTYFMKKVIQKIRQENWKKAVIDGIRLPLGVKTFREEFGKNIKVVLVTAKPEVRFERMKTRGRPGFPKTLEDFRKHEEREWEKFDFKKTFGMTSLTINNDGTWDELREQIKQMMEKVWVK